MLPGRTAVSGAVLFARFAYPPNELGYCGPADARALLVRAAAGDDEPELRRLARQFDGAWPYLEMIAGANGLADPLDPRVVEAYWVGNALLDRVAPLPDWPDGALPCHAFHVLGVYPWLGLLRKGRVTEPLHVLDRCRIRWGRVEAVDDEHAVVRSRPLAWDGHRLHLGLPRVETVTLGTEGVALVSPPAVGDWCALHWDWVCDVLSPRRLAALRRRTAEQLAAVSAPSLSTAT
jgi:hypothetical protein